LGSLGLVNLKFWRCWARCPKDCFVGVGTISCNIGVCKTIKGVTVSSLNGVQPCLLDQEAKTGMVEAHEGTDAGEVEGFGVVGGAGCLGCHGHGMGCLIQEHNGDDLPGSAGSLDAVARVRLEC
jgi:hypothetical protein